MSSSCWLTEAMSANGCQKRVVAVLTAMARDGSALPTRRASNARRLRAPQRRIVTTTVRPLIVSTGSARAPNSERMSAATARARCREPSTVIVTSSADQTVRTVPSSDVHSYVRLVAGSWIATTATRLSSEGNIGERLDVGHDDVDRLDVLGWRGQGGLEVHGRVALDEHVDELGAADAAAAVLARDQVLALTFGIDQRHAVEDVAFAAGERAADLDRVVRAVAGERHGRVEHHGRAAALELGDHEDEVAAVGAALALRHGAGRQRRRGRRRRGRRGRARRPALAVAATAAGDP